ncbi:hypothetical protein NW768_004119 [Fusarium equiseti]|uniref:Protein kinase domain-containing protein n=1 Tax=Fusarium equiseti TaxID=61235 RepID=A0ABQ8RJH9_FUSEQ|nr:hypothetical protein NW768_004119 [Fusarium equiseti]
MARSYHNKAPLTKLYRTATGPRTIPITDPNGIRLARKISIGPVNVWSRDETSVIFVPGSRNWEEEEADDPDAPWRQDAEGYACLKTSFAYEVIGEEHPGIVPVLGQDAWTGLPILLKPTYGSLWNFFEEYEEKVYSAQAGATLPNSRIKPEFLPLAYQWSLQLLSALALMHSHNIAYGEIIPECCWLSAETLDISLAGFYGSEFRDPKTGWNCPGWFFTDNEFSPDALSLSRENVPTCGTDMFIFARLMHCIMTSHNPGEGMGRESGETERLARDEDWMPDLEDEFMGEILHKCWRFDYYNIHDLQNEVRALIESYGWLIVDDKLKGLDIERTKRLLRGGVANGQ